MKSYKMTRGMLFLLVFISMMPVSGKSGSADVVSNDYSRDPGLTLIKDTSEKCRDNIRGAFYPIPSTAGENFTQEFDVLQTKQTYYCNSTVGLSSSKDKSKINISFGKTNRPEGTTLPETTISFLHMNAEGKAVAIGDFIQTDTGVVYHVKLEYLKSDESFVRAMVVVKEGDKENVVFDSDKLQVAGITTMDRVEFNVRSATKESKICYNPEEKKIYLQGGWDWIVDGTNKATYLSGAYVDDMVISENKNSPRR